MSRPNRRVHEPDVDVGYQETVRKFGNIVNRPDKYGHTAGNKPDASMKRYTGLQNSKPYPHYRQGQNNYQVENYGPQVEYQDKQTTSQLVFPQSNAQDNYPREPTGKNREFVAKVENINKIHDQIHSMLKIVKDVQSRSAIKYKQDTKERPHVRNEQNIERIIKHRLRENPEKIKNDEPKYEDNQIILPITSNARRRIDTSTIDNQRTIQKSNFQQTHKHPKLNNYLCQAQQSKTNIQKYQRHQNSKSVIQKQKSSTQIYARGREYNNKQIQNLSPSPIRKQVEPTYTLNKQKKQQKHKKQIYSYNYQSKEDQQQVTVSRNITEDNKPDKIDRLERSIIDYDYQISKVKQRIQNSEQMTKKLQQRYLGAGGHAQNKQNDKSRISAQRLQARHKFLEQLQNEEDKLRNKLDRTQHRKYDDSLDLRQQFQIKVTPCKQTSSEHPIKKDQICKLISQKLSEQIKLDQKLRDIRQRFSNCKLEQKWQILHKKLKSLGYCISEDELENELIISPNQKNPFNLDENSADNVVDELADAFAKAQKYWQQNILHSIAKSSLTQSGFNVKEMDLDHRGYLTVEDLVCFINLYSTNFFRNRDMIHLFKRMVALGKNRNGIQYQNFMNIIAHQ